MGFRLISTSMTLDDLERRNSSYFAFFADFGFFAGQIRYSGWRLTYNVRKYCLPVPVVHFGPPLSHPAARSLCDSWATCLVRTRLQCAMLSIIKWYQADEQQFAQNCSWHVQMTERLTSLSNQHFTTQAVTSARIYVRIIWYTSVADVVLVTSLSGGSGCRRAAYIGRATVHWLAATSDCLDIPCEDEARRRTVRCTSFKTSDVVIDREKRKMVTGYKSGVAIQLIRVLFTGAALLENNEASAKLTTANGWKFTWAQLDSVANHVTARSICDWRALTWLATETGWTRRKRSAICSVKLISGYVIWYDVNRRYGI